MRRPRLTWDEAKRPSNIAKHGYDFAGLGIVFDGRPMVRREDRRREYDELRYNTLVMHRGRVVNLTFTPCDGGIHMISARPASRAEREVYRARIAQTESGH